MSAIGLPVQVLRLFQARPPLEWIPAGGARETLTQKLTGLSDLVGDLDAQCGSPRRAEGSQMTVKQESRKKVKRVRCVESRREVFVGRLPRDATERQLRREVEKVCSRAEVKIVYDRKGRSRQYGFVQLEDEKSAMELCRRGIVLEGRRIIVELLR